MSFQDSDQPLGEQFLQNPYEYLQSFVRKMNNEIFLSEYQLGNLYALLLLKKQSPWDELRPNTSNLKGEIEQLVNTKIVQVKKMLQSLSQVYQSKLKRNTFTQIQRLMSILKAKNKSIFIEKDFHYRGKNIQAQGKLIKGLIEEQLEEKLGESQGLLGMQQEKQSAFNNGDNNTKQRTQVNSAMQTQPEENLMFTQYGEQRNDKIHDQHDHNQQKYNHQCQHHHHCHSHQQDLCMQQQRSHSHHIDRRNNNDQREVLQLFYGIANIPNLSSLALGNCIEYSSAERYIKFQMSKNYIMTIKNDDELSYDRTSLLSQVSSDLFIHKIFPYLTAVELFKVRAVCKEWMENVKEAWHSTFKREMFIQLMACQFCKEIEFYYKLIQLRNPFFQKISLLMHALIEIIQWQKVNEDVNNGTLAPQLKKVLIILLKLLGEPIVTPSLNSITEQIWQQHKQKILTLKQRISHFLNNIQSSGLSIIQLMKIKIQLLDDPFMRVQQLNSQDKTPLLLVIFIKQLTLQQILKNHIYFSQEYLMNTKKRLDNISSKMPQQKGFLEGVYKIILLRSFGGKGESQNEKQEKSEMPNFSSILSSIFDGNDDMDKPDFVLKSKSTLTNIYMDKATKLDIIVSTVKKMNAFDNSNRDTLNEEKINASQKQNQMADQMNKQKSNQHLELNQNQNNQSNETAKKQLQTVNIYNINLGQEQKSTQDHTANTINKSNTQNQQNEGINKKL